MSYTNNSFILNYLKLYHTWLYSLFKALATLTSLKSHSSTNVHARRFPTASVYNLIRERREALRGTSPICQQ